MQNTIQKSRECSTVLKKPNILSEYLKTLTSFNYPTVPIFFAESSHTFSMYQCLQKDVWDFFNFI